MSATLAPSQVNTHFKSILYHTEDSPIWSPISCVTFNVNFSYCANLLTLVVTETQRESNPEAQRQGEEKKTQTNRHTQNHRDKRKGRETNEQRKK